MYASQSWVKELVTRLFKKNNEYIVPIGTVINYMGNTAPTGYFTCDGTEYNIVDYPNFCDYLITQFGSVNYFGGDGEITFAVPDLRGEFLRGSGTATRDSGSGGEVGEHQEPTQHIGIRSMSDGNSLYVGWQDGNHATENYPDVTKYLEGSRYTQKASATKSSTTAERVDYYTSRPTNTSVLYCIKY